MLSHVDHKNRPQMVPVVDKKTSKRRATAHCLIDLPPSVRELFGARDDPVSKKGPVFSTAVIAGTMAVKKTSEWIPFCHPVPIEACRFDLRTNRRGQLEIRCTVETTYKTGVEMEALVGVSAAALAIYDMCKAVSHDIHIGSVRLLAKSGGKKDYATQSSAPVLKGLVLSGGRSRRMGEDKARLRYGSHKAQATRCLELLQEVCSSVYLSTRFADHRELLPEGMELVLDRFVDFGPVGGILSAMTLDASAGWLVVACDLPFLDTKTLRYLVDHRQVDHLATAFASDRDRLPEPLCAIYEPTAKAMLLEGLGAGSLCPRQLLLDAEVPLLDLPQPDALDNVNDPIHRRTVLDTMQVRL